MTRTDSHSGFDTLFGALASLTLPVQGGLGRPLHGAVTRPRQWPVIAQAVDVLLTWSERVRQRRQLMEFDDHLLRDIGVTRADALAEAAKPFWRA
jgi:uncharacterized protein YjiS (DUF1127 family)